MKDTRILIVDDSPFQIALLSDVLEEQGFEVVGQAMSLEEVKSEVKRTKPDLVTMDLTIPGTDGFECTKAVHDIDSNIKVIVVSSMMDEELINKAKKLGISGFIQKPVDTEELTLLINRVMADEDLFCELEILYLGAYTEATLNIFNRLTKTVPEITNISFENKEKTSAGISIVLGIIGKYSGRLIMDMSLETAEKFSECLLRRKAKNNEEVLNVVSEVANMLAGNGCSIINKKNKVFGLRVAPPTTIHGESINISKAELECNFSADIKSEFGDISLNLGFRRGESEWMSDI
ncbi:MULTISPECIES: response regulator [Clostridium]|jgi:DNA-binding NarL/FixJ family response regulator|uniref:Stage 0 sporulation protein A homolog n=5 Tax=Clostridium TaxID=1485 RepID=A0A6L9EKQ9_CLOBU|nr:MULTISPECIES: response regulator [Clostridium]ETI87907.1 MAG: Response regulator receiver protein [Clostridium butyricum DORA_1]AXB84970.1 response regulator [Clostridium butyricum]EMU54561.1 chemotaxis response regulator/CheC-like domain protein [Clostridium butyricum DKU-01]KIU08000.1 response regulator receiver domain protein [Clostridium butyricum]KJZ85442.1 Chemotaxis protein cheY [Clostridium sp. IBUN22A]